MVLISVQDLFRQYLKLDPGIMTYYTTIVGLPWSIKIIYGLISDNLPILGLKRKSYIIMMGLIQFICLASIYVFEVENGFYVTLLLCASSMALAFINVVIDAIIIV